MIKKNIKWFFVVFSIIAFISFFENRNKENTVYNGYNQTSYSQALSFVSNNDAIKVVFDQSNNTVKITTQDNKSISAITPENPVELIEKAKEHNIDVEFLPIEKPQKESFLFSFFIMLLPVLILCAVMIWLHKRQMDTMRGGNNIEKLSKTNSMNVINNEDNKVRLSDVAGNNQAKEEVAEIVQFLKEPDKYNALGAKVPKGVLMSGPPGTGKTLLAKAIAGEAGVPFYSVSGSDFMEVFVGLGASRVRKLFEEAKKNSPSIVFIDEIDSIGKKRGNAFSGNVDGEREQTLNALLTEMDGFSSNESVIVIAATNRTDVLDDALKRPGRFDREVSVSLPDRQEREEILKVHLKKVPVETSVNTEEISASTPGFSGADLANLVNEAAVMAARESSKLIGMKHFDNARDKIIMGVNRNPLKNQEERRVIAYHEAGHAIVAHFTEFAEPVYKISILPRGRALGVTVQVPKEDIYNYSQQKLEGDMAVLMGGRAAEDLVIGRKTTGASNDFMRATVIARRMVASWGMDDDFGPLSIDGESGYEYANTNIWSEEIKREADNKVKALVKKSYQNALQILKDKEKQLHQLAEELLKNETVDAKKFIEIIES